MLRVYVKINPNGMESAIAERHRQIVTDNEFEWMAARDWIQQGMKVCVPEVLTETTVDDGLDNRGIQAWALDGVSQPTFDGIMLPVSPIQVFDSCQRRCLLSCNALHPRMPTHSLPTS